MAIFNSYVKLPEGKPPEKHLQDDDVSQRNFQMSNFFGIFLLPRCAELEGMNALSYPGVSPAIPRHLGRVFPGHLENMYLVEALNVPWQDDHAWTTFARGHLPCLKTCHCICMYILLYKYNIYLWLYMYIIYIFVYMYNTISREKDAYII